MPSTIRLHRVFKTTPECLYKAFTKPEALVKWMPPHGFTAQVHDMDFRKARKVMVGAELNITQEGVPDAIPAEACYLG